MGARIRMRNPYSLLLLVLLTGTASAATVIVDQNQQFQTITGWEAHSQSGHEYAEWPLFNESLLDQAVNDLGLTRLRVEIRSGAENNRDYFTESMNGTIDTTTWRCVRFASINDDSDPFNINWNGFQFSAIDNMMDKVVMPFKQLVEANGEKFHFNLNYVAFINGLSGTNCPPGLSYHQGDDPEEYAELIAATSTTTET